MQLSQVDIVLQTCYWHYLSDYQMILFSQRQTRKQKGPGVCGVCLQSVLALTQHCTLSQLSSMQPSTEPKSDPDLHHQLSPLAELVDIAEVPCVGTEPQWRSWDPAPTHHSSASAERAEPGNWLCCCLRAFIFKNGAWADTLATIAVL